MRLLLVEDNKRLSELVRDGLHLAGFETDLAERGEDALSMAQTQNYDLVVLDLGLPDIDGLEVLKSIRSKNKSLPVLILTARDTLGDKVIGLNMGADDYLPKPFAMDELTARVRALLRRPGHALGQVLEAGNISFDTISRDVLIAGAPVRMSRRETDLLEQLMRRFGHVVSKETIEEKLYSFEEEGSSNSVEVLVHRLRKKLESLGATPHIHTLRGIGYLLSGQTGGGGGHAV